ncbi:spore coat protein U domain-containing protein [Enterobacter asburiae]|uniref:spore coat protein U domain-containing protein n=1 Tax=Enterobacter asburiae TaxID=61645 RepID=UPI00403D8112
MFKKIILLIFVILFSNVVNAACSFVEGGLTQASANIGDVEVQRDTPVGTVLKTITVNFPAVGVICDAGTEGRFTPKTFTTPSALDNVFDTNIPGVGIRQILYYGTVPFEHYTSSNIGYQRIEWVKIELVKTGTAAVSGYLTQGPIFDWSVGEGEGAAATFPVVRINLTSGYIGTKACSIQSGGTLSFPIGNVPAEQFRQIGTVSNETVKADISLSCNNNTNVNVTLNGEQNPETSDASVLALSGQGSESVAKGIGVQLLYNGAPLKLNEMLKFETTESNAIVTYPLTARYIQTEDKIKAGSANATATLNLTYQ